MPTRDQRKKKAKQDAYQAKKNRDSSADSVSTLPPNPEPSVHESADTDKENENPSTSNSVPKNPRGRPKKGTHDGRKGAGRPSKPKATAAPDNDSTIPNDHAAAQMQAADEKEQEAERIAKELNEENFKVPVIPLRRSTRTIKAPIRYTDTHAPNVPDFAEVTNDCMHTQHPGLGCAAIDADHYPEYYDSTATTYVCPYETCKALLLNHEIDSVKCCNKGQVDLSKHWENLQKQPDELAQFKDERHPDHEQFMKDAWRYNQELAFGTLSLKMEDVPHGLWVAKINGNIKYHLSDLHYPQQHMPQQNPAQQDSAQQDTAQQNQAKKKVFTRKWGQCYTIAPDEAIKERIDHLDAKKQLKPEIIAELHRMLDQYHVLAKAYKHCAEYYAEKKKSCDQLGIDMPKFTLTLMNKRQAVKEGANIDAGIHNHRLLLPTENGMMQCATVHFDEGDDNGPPKERGVTLTGKDGRIVDFAPFDPNIDAALFPLLFPYGQRTYELGIPLKKAEKKENEVTPSVDPDASILYEQFSDDEEPDEETAIDLIDHPGDEEDEAAPKANAQPEEEPDPSDNDDPADGEVVDCTPGGAKWKKSKGAHKFVSRRQFYRYLFQIRGDSWLAYHWLWWSLTMAQILILSVHNQNEANEAHVIKQMQANLVTILPVTLIAALQNKIRLGRFGAGIAAKLGKVFFAPETFRGSRRYYQKAYADAQSICRAYGNPHILLTFTMNSEAPEFKKLLAKTQKWPDRPDVVTKLFINKHEELMKDIVDRAIFGPVAAWFSAVEHQKRGLPHLHMCIILQCKGNNYFEQPGWKEEIINPEEWCRQYICAEIPTLPPKNATSKKADRQREYHATVVKHMAHRCSAACIVDGKCSKRFPKPFSLDNVVSAETYPVYRRRPPAPNAQEKAANPHLYGETYTVPSRTGTGRIIDNRHIVAHNPYLIKKYKSHINIEWIQGDATAKYVTKYITKGCDLALVKVQNEKDGAPAVVNYDELEEIRLGVYRTSSEAGLGIWGHKIFSKSHHVQTLYIHEPGNINVVFEDGQQEEVAEKEKERIANGEERKSQLTEYFRLNQKLKDDGKDNIRLEHTYATISQDYWWSKNAKTWFQRKRKIDKLVRIGSAAPGNIALQAIRLLLLTVKGPTSFDDLKIDENNKTHASFVDCAIARGLMIDDKLWDQTIKDAMLEKRSVSERIRWFALFIANVLPKKPQVLLETHFASLTEWPRMTDADKMERLLKRIEITLRIHGIQPNDLHETSCQMVGLQAPKNFRMSDDDLMQATYFRDEYMARHLGDKDDDDDAQPTTNYGAKYVDWYAKCTETEQKPFVDAVFKAVQTDPSDKDVPRYFFLTGAGGTGKTFTYNTIIARMKSSRLPVLPCATTGIAAELLIEGSTVHRRFGVPNDVKHDTQPRLARHSHYAMLLNAAKLIIIDEVSMQDRFVLEYLDRLLKSISSDQHSKLPFAGKVVIIGGDWKQLMPVIPGKDEANQFARSVKSSHLYSNFTTTRLTINKRLANSDKRTQKFARYMYKLATGVTTDEKNRIEVPKSLTTHDENEIMNFVFPPAAMTDPIKYADQIKGSALLCPTNDETFKMNNMLLEKIPGQTYTFTAIDEPNNDNPLDCLSVNAADKFVENIHRQTPSGFPPYQLHVKVGAIMMLNRNLSVIDGQCNGTRVQIVKIVSDNVIMCKHINGARAGQEFLLYKCTFTDGGGSQEQNESAMKWSRIQFPLRPGFVMTINKSQGQTLDRVGIVLQNSECFSHGQLYVAFSRVRDPDSLLLLTRPNALDIKNIVYQQVIDKAEVDEAFKMAEEDMERERAGSPRFEHNDPPATPAGTPATQAFITPRVSIDGSAPSTSDTTKRTIKQSPAATPRTGTNPKKTRCSDVIEYQDSDYGGTAPNGQTFYGRFAAQLGSTMLRLSNPDGNCFFHSVAWCTNSTHVELRQHAAAILERIGNNGTVEQQIFLENQITGVLPDGVTEFVNKYQGNITNYARNFTAKKKTYVGAPEAIALAHHLQRTIAIITPQSEEERQRQLQLGNDNPMDMVFVYLPNFEIRQHQINHNCYSQAWVWEREPIVVLHNGFNHYDGLEWIEQGLQPIPIPQPLPETPKLKAKRKSTDKFEQNVSLDNSILFTRSFINTILQILANIPEIASSNFEQIQMNASAFPELIEIQKIMENKTKSAKQLKAMLIEKKLLPPKQFNPLEFLSAILTLENPFEWKKLFEFEIRENHACQGENSEFYNGKNCGQVFMEKCQQLFYNIFPGDGEVDLTKLLLSQGKEETAGVCKNCSQVSRIRQTVSTATSSYLVLSLNFERSLERKIKPNFIGYDENSQEIFGYKWRMVAALIHSPKTTQRHYYVYLRDDKNKCWWKVNEQDSPKKKMAMKKNLKRVSVLFFEKVQEAMEIEQPIIQSLARVQMDPNICAEKHFLLPSNTDRIVDSFWHGGLRMKAKSSSVSTSDLKRLKGTEWLNDAIITSYLRLIHERSDAQPNLPKIYWFEPYLCDSLESSKGSQSVRRWIKRQLGQEEKLFDFDQIFFPVNINANHWILIVVLPAEKEIIQYDSLDGPIHSRTQGIRGLIEEIWDSHHPRINWILKQANQPAQKNSYDCGVYICVFAEHYSMNRQMDYIRPSDMPFFRKKILSELVTGELCAFELNSVNVQPNDRPIESKYDKVHVVHHDITTLKVDAIVNAANSTLLGGGGVDGAIHQAAGPDLKTKCSMLGGCNVGECKSTPAYKIKTAKMIIHTVGPQIHQDRKIPDAQERVLLQSCYTRCLTMARDAKMKSIAFPCISTGIYGYPPEEAATDAINAVQNWLSQPGNADWFDAIIFCVWGQRDLNIYQKKLF